MPKCIETSLEIKRGRAKQVPLYDAELARAPTPPPKGLFPHSAVNNAWSIAHVLNVGNEDYGIYPARLRLAKTAMYNIFLVFLQIFAHNFKGFGPETPSTGVNECAGPE